MYFNIGLSPPDEKQAALDVTDPRLEQTTSGSSIWYAAAVSSRSQRPRSRSYPLWSPRGERLVFSSNREGGGIFI